MLSFPTVYQRPFFVIIVKNAAFDKILGAKAVPYPEKKKLELHKAQLTDRKAGIDRIHTGFLV